MLLAFWKTNLIYSYKRIPLCMEFEHDLTLIYHQTNWFLHHLSPTVITDHIRTLIELWSYPGYFQELNWFSMGLLYISRWSLTDMHELTSVTKPKVCSASTFPLHTHTMTPGVAFKRYSEHSFPAVGLMSSSVSLGVLPMWPSKELDSSTRYASQNPTQEDRQWTLVLTLNSLAPGRF